MAQLANRWAEQGAEISLVTWSSLDSDAYPVNSRVQRHGLDLLRPSKTPLHGLLANLGRVRRLRRKLNEIAPDFVLSFSDQMNIVALEAARGLGVPIWIAEHSDPEQQKLSRFWEAWRQRSYPSCTGCVALTQSIAKYMERWISAERLAVIPPAIDPPADTAWWKRERGSAQVGRILTVGRLSAEKDHSLLLTAWSRVADKLPGWHLRMVGDGPERQQLSQLAATLPRVELAGWQDNVWSEFRQADLFVLSSRYEGFPVAMLEAMSQATCCVTTDCTASVDQLQGDGRCLEVVPTEDASSLAEVILQLAEDPQARTVLGCAAQQVSQHYNWKHVGRKWDAILSSD